MGPVPDRPSYWPKRGPRPRRDTPSDPAYERVAGRAGRRCEYCKAPEAIFSGYFTVDHIVPRAWGGLTFDGNLALASRTCNDAKRALLGGLDPATGLPVWLFNPRVDAWDEHFRIDLQTGTIEGTTETGRTTAAALKMNHPKPRDARLLWIALGIYP
jgi:hypothetical protein